MKGRDFPTERVYIVVMDEEALPLEPVDPAPSPNTDPPKLGRPPSTTHHVARGAKSCTTCGVVRKYRMFSPLPKGIGGVHSICKRCRADAGRNSRAQDREV